MQYFSSLSPIFLPKCPHLKRGISGFPLTHRSHMQWCTIKWAPGPRQKTLSWAVKAGREDRCLYTAFTGNFSRFLCLQRALLEEVLGNASPLAEEGAGSCSTHTELPPFSRLLEWLSKPNAFNLDLQTLQCQCTVMTPRSDLLLTGSSRSLISGSPHLPLAPLGPLPDPWVKCWAWCPVWMSFEKCIEGIRAFLTLWTCWGDLFRHV